EIKANKEKQRQLEEKMEAERQSNEEKMRQMKEKMDETRLQREEFERAMDGKLREQADLLKKAFEEKAGMMRRKIEEFKKWSTEAKTNRARVFALILENANRRHEETMALMMQNHRGQMMDHH
ncbi:hypothetical protein M9458_050676, partial [Cirrhinus mrigala]